MSFVYLGLGSNMGDRFKNLNDALLMIEERLGNIVKESGIYKTEPWGFVTENFFLNMAVCLSAEADPFDILKDVMMIEKSLGRTRKGAGYSSRTIDIDILFIDGVIIDHPDLVIPHPLIAERMFVLKPLMDIAPGFIHPLLNISISDLTLECKDNLEVVRIKQIPDRGQG